MFARIIEFEAEGGAQGHRDAAQAFERLAAAEMRRQPGYEGAYALRSDGARGILVALWESESAMLSAEATPGLARALDDLRATLRHPATASYEVAYADHRVK